MLSRSKAEVYRLFLEYVSTVTRKERSVTNRRIFDVMLWCFILPAGTATLMMVLIQWAWLPRFFRGYIDGVILLFPICYSIYFLGSQVLSKAVVGMKRGGVATVLSESQKEGFWREEVCGEFHRLIPADLEEWRWIQKNFEMDLAAIQQRTRFMTALAGAVFFFILHGIDSLSSAPPETFTLQVIDWVDGVSSGMSQMIGLMFFLLLFYLSGNQNYHALRRYLNCVELMIIEKEFHPTAKD